MENANKQRDLFKRENKFCLKCEIPFWGWPSDKNCLVCRTPVEEAASINITHTQMLREQANSGDHKS